MRLIAIMMGVLLFGAVVAEGVYLARTQRELKNVTRKLEQMQASAERQRDDQGDPGDRRDSGGGYPEFDDGPRGDGRGTPPEFAPAMAALAEAARQAGGLRGVAEAADHPLPLPPAFSTPEAREQLTNFVRAQLVREQEAEREQRVQRWTDREGERHNEWAKDLGLEGTTAQRFGEILSTLDDKRREMFVKARDEGRPLRDVRGEMGESYRQTNTELRNLLGDENFKKYIALSQGAQGRRDWGGGGPGPGGPDRGGVASGAPAPAAPGGQQ